MMMPGREYQAQPTRFGFNGKENDNDVKGFGNQEDYGMRIHDNRIGRFLSGDPLTKGFPGLSPYHSSGNNPIRYIDLDGGEIKDPMQEAKDGTTLINIFNSIIESQETVFFTTMYPPLQAVFIRQLLRNGGYEVPKVSDIELSAAFDIEVQGRGNFVLVPEKSILNKLFTLTFASINLVGAIPTKGTPYLAIKLAPVTAAAISDIIRTLKVGARAKEIAANFKDLTKGGNVNLSRFESESGAILENTFNLTLRQLIPGEQGDYAVVAGAISGKLIAGKTIDQFGVPADALKYNSDLSNFFESIDTHFNKVKAKSVDYLLMDVRALNSDQLSKVQEYIKMKHSQNADKLIIINK